MAGERITRRDTLLVVKSLAHPTVAWTIQITNVAWRETEKGGFTETGIE